MKGKGLLILIVIAGIATVGYRWLPPYYNPFVPLTLDDPPGKITQFKLRRLTPQACESLLAQANQRQLIRTQSVADSAGECPLSNVVRVRDFGPVSLNSVLNIWAASPAAISTAARMRGAANMPRRMRWIAALSGWQMDSALPS